MFLGNICHISGFSFSLSLSLFVFLRPQHTNRLASAGGGASTPECGLVGEIGQKSHHQASNARNRRNWWFTVYIF